MKPWKMAWSLVQAVPPFPAYSQSAASSLESQPALDSIRDQAGRVPRKALKHRKEVSPKWFRYIPIAESDKETRNIIVRRWKRAVVELEGRRYGDDERDYLLFDGLTARNC